jgi:hypothetical protein
MGQLSFGTCLQSIHYLCLLLSLSMFLLVVFLIIVYLFGFQMSCSLYLCIVHVVEGHDDYFVPKKDRNQRLGL